MQRHISSSVKGYSSGTEECERESDYVSNYVYSYTCI